MDEESIYLRLEKQDNMPFSKEHFSYALETVKLADCIDNMALSFEARYNLCWVAMFVNEYAAAINAFIWCTGAYEKDPDNCDSNLFIWMYKWTFHACTEFQGLSRKKIDKLLKDFKHHLKILGYGERSFYYYKFCLSLVYGDAGDIKSDGLKWHKLPRESISECEACEKANHVRALIFQENYKEALYTAEPLLKGKLSCEAEPHRIIAELLVPLTKLGKFEEAHSHHLKGYRLIKNKLWRSPAQFRHIYYLAFVGMLDGAVQIFRDHFKDIDDTQMLAYKSFHIYRCSWFLMERLLEKGHKSLTLPSLKNDSFFDNDCTYPIKDVSNHFKSKVEEVAKNLDKRNENNYYRKLLSSDSVALN